MSDETGRFWMVWNDGPFGRTPTYKHPSPEAAQQEANRLARVFPGQRFWVLEAQGFMRTADPCTWTPAESGLPF